MGPGLRISRATIAGVLYALAFPSFNLHYLAWVALVPLLLIERPRFLHGFIAGFVANLIIFFWLWKTFNAAQVGFPVTLISWLGLAGVLACYFGLFAEIYGRLPANVFRPLFVALIWALLELVRCKIMTGFPWALFAHTQVRNVPLLQWAAYGGEPLISFLLIYVNATVASFFRERRPATNIAFACTALMLILLLIVGGQIRDKKQLAMENGPTMKIALLQGNINQYQKWDAAYEAGIRQRYEELVEAAAKIEPDLIIWPESSVPGWFPNDPEYVEWVKNVVMKSGVPHLIGSVTRLDEKEYNAAFLIHADGEIAAQYAKQKMVPFGEYIPFGGFLRKYVPYLGHLGTFDAGDRPVMFDVKGGKVAPNICYEAFFAPLIYKSVQQGADIIVNITNDGWFLDSAAPEQHFVANQFRAVENGRPVLRAANTGISAVIDMSGTVRYRSDLLVKGMFVESVPLYQEPTFFSMLYSRLCHAN